ncbi:MAG: hypothetical protein Q9226_007647 [Calogaya cf. arnoldii]
MSMLVRKPAQHDLRIGSKAAEVAAFEPFDYNHVRDKYPQAEGFAVSRLGHANTRRRQYLKYRERHALKLKQGIINTVADMDDNATSELVLSETIATDVQDCNVSFDDKASQSGISQTSYAPTLMGGGDITIPTPPRGSRGGAPFECPYCYFIITATSTRSWNRHVFDDLQPYVCLDKTCTTPHKLYTKRHEWAHHTTIMHHYEDSGESRKCILCGDPQGTAQQYDRHVARHLQELALFVLPQRNDEEPDSDEPCTESKSDSSIASSGPESSPASLGNIAKARVRKRRIFSPSEREHIARCTNRISREIQDDDHPDSTVDSKKPINNREGPSATDRDGSEDDQSNWGPDKRGNQSAAEGEIAEKVKSGSSWGRFWLSTVGHDSPFAATPQASQLAEDRDLEEGSDNGTKDVIQIAQDVLPVSDTPDILVLKWRSTSHPLHFPAGVIANGAIRIGESVDLSHGRL